MLLPGAIFKTLRICITLKKEKKEKNKREWKEKIRCAKISQVYRNKMLEDMPWTLMQQRWKLFEIGKTSIVKNCVYRNFCFLNHCNLFNIYTCNLFLFLQYYHWLAFQHTLIVYYKLFREVRSSFHIFFNVFDVIFFGCNFFFYWCAKHFIHFTWMVRNLFFFTIFVVVLFFIHGKKK